MEESVTSPNRETIACFGQGKFAQGLVLPPISESFMLFLKAGDVQPQVGLKLKSVPKFNTNPGGVCCNGTLVVNFSFLQLFVCVKDVSEYLRIGRVFSLF